MSPPAYARYHWRSSSRRAIRFICARATNAAANASKGSERHFRRIFNLLHREGGGHIAQLHGLDQALVEAVITADVGRDNLHQVIHLAAHAVKLDNLRHPRDCSSELAQPFFVVLTGSYADENGDREPDARAIEDRHLLLDVTLILQPPDALPTRGGRKAHMF